MNNAAKPDLDIRTIVKRVISNPEGYNSIPSAYKRGIPRIHLRNNLKFTTKRVIQVAPLQIPRSYALGMFNNEKGQPHSIFNFFLF